MNSLPLHSIPEQFFDIQANDNVTEFSLFEKSVLNMRTDEQQYFNAYQGMIFLSEVVEAKHLVRYSLNKVRIL